MAKVKNKKIEKANENSEQKKWSFELILKKFISHKCFMKLNKANISGSDYDLYQVVIYNYFPETDKYEKIFDVLRKNKDAALYAVQAELFRRNFRYNILDDDEIKKYFEDKIEK